MIYHDMWEAEEDGDEYKEIDCYCFGSNQRLLCRDLLAESDSSNYHNGIFLGLLLPLLHSFGDI